MNISEIKQLQNQLVELVNRISFCLQCLISYMTTLDEHPDLLTHSQKQIIKGTKGKQGPFH